MSLNVNNFKSQLTGGGARSSLFKVTIAFPEGIGAAIGEKSSFMIKQASIPETSVAAIEVDFRGRKIKVPGNRSFSDYSITVINDTDFEIHSAFVKWLDSINSHIANTGFNDTTSYEADVLIEQLDRSGNPIKAFTLVGAWPNSLGEISLDYSSDSIEEFQVTLSYQWWTSAETN